MDNVELFPPFAQGQAIPMCVEASAAGTAIAAAPLSWAQDHLAGRSGRHTGHPAAR